MKDVDFICHLPTNEKDERFAHDLIGIARDATELKPSWNMSHVMVSAGVFSSISQAKKAGWNIPIPDGFSEHSVGRKNRRDITILNNFNSIHCDSKLDWMRCNSQVKRNQLFVIK